MSYVICLLLRRRGSRGGMSLIIFVHEIFGDLSVRLYPHQKLAILSDLALQDYNDVALLAILIEELVDLVHKRRDHFLAASLEQRLIVLGLSVERLLQLRPLFYPAVAHGGLNIWPILFNFIFQFL